MLKAASTEMKDEQGAKEQLARAVADCEIECATQMSAI